MKRKTEEDEEFIGSLKTMFKRPGNLSRIKEYLTTVSNPPPPKKKHTQM